MNRESGFKNYKGEDRSNTELEETWGMDGPEAQPASNVICSLMSDSLGNRDSCEFRFQVQYTP